MLEENKSLQATINILRARLLQERHSREDLEVKVMALEKDKQLLEAVNYSLSEQLGRSGDQ